MTTTSTLPFSISDVLGDTLEKIQVIDVGALPLEGHRESYDGLIEAGMAHVIGFEPVGDACEKLNAKHEGTHTFLPHFVGDGTKGTFRLCNYEMTSSLLEPNQPLLDKFSQLNMVCRVVDEFPVETTRLDDLPDCRGTDYLKMDVQGGELGVVNGATEVLKDVLVIESEVEFIPLYKDQPLYAEMDQALRSHGFMFHKFLGLASRTFLPMQVGGSPANGLSQHVWSDGIWVRDFMKPEVLSDAQLLKTAAILHDVYGSYDFALFWIGLYDKRAGTDFASAYMAGFQGRRIAS